MSTLNIASTITTTGWADRRPELMISSILLNSNVLSDFTVIEGVKKKAMIPIQDASIKYGTAFCNIKAGGDGSLSLGEKAVSNSEHTWYFSNCQTSLYDTFRSQMMRKGSNTGQTMDDELKQWLFDYFAKANAQKLVVDAATQLKTLMKADTAVTKLSPVANEGILDTLKRLYLAVPKALMDRIAGGTTEEFKPTIYMNSENIRKYMIAVAEKNSAIQYGMGSAEVPMYLGMNVKLFPSLSVDDIIITQPANLLVITDDLGDTSAINARYDELTSTDEFYGKFMIGFNYRKGDEVVAMFGASTFSMMSEGDEAEPATAPARSARK